MKILTTNKYIALLRITQRWHREREYVCMFVSFTVTGDTQLSKPEICNYSDSSGILSHLCVCLKHLQNRATLLKYIFRSIRNRFNDLLSKSWRKYRLKL
jgi:hypothetical protein